MLQKSEIRKKTKEKYKNNQAILFTESGNNTSHAHAVFGTRSLNVEGENGQSDGECSGKGKGMRERLGREWK